MGLLSRERGVSSISIRWKWAGKKQLGSHGRKPVAMPCVRTPQAISEEVTNLRAPLASARASVSW